MGNGPVLLLGLGKLLLGAESLLGLCGRNRPGQQQIRADMLCSDPTLRLMTAMSTMATPFPATHAGDTAAFLANPSHRCRRRHAGDFVGSKGSWCACVHRKRTGILTLCCSDVELVMLSEWERIFLGRGGEAGVLDFGSQGCFFAGRGFCVDSPKSVCELDAAQKWGM